MSTPTVERTRPSRQANARRGGRASGSVPLPRTPGGAIGRAYARRAGRQQRLAGVSAEGSGRSQFVLMIMVLLGAGLVASLWLSTTAAADSYRLDAARAATRDLSERSESLRSEIASMQSAPALAQAAQSLGMVQSTDVARLVAAPDGKVTVVGTPKVAVAAPPPAPLAPPIPAFGAPAVPQPAAPGVQPAPAAVGAPQPAAPVSGAPQQAELPVPGQVQQPATSDTPATSGTPATSDTPATPAAQGTSAAGSGR